MKTRDYRPHELFLLQGMLTTRYTFYDDVEVLEDISSALLLNRDHMATSAMQTFWWQEEFPLKRRTPNRFVLTGQISKLTDTDLDSTALPLE